jgi:hypothetical protein
MDIDKSIPIGSEEYNEEPVYFCAHCLSLAIKDVGIGYCCLDCGSTSIAHASIEKYDELHKAKYGKKKFYK